MPIPLATADKLTDILEQNECHYYTIWTPDEDAVLAIHWTHANRREHGVITDRTLVSDLPDWWFNRS